MSVISENIKKGARVYLYPMTRLEDMASKNPYIDNLISSLADSIDIVNNQDFSKLGILNAYKYLTKADIFYFNWLENIPFRKLGIFQFLPTLLLYFILKISGKKIIWTLHNKNNHGKKSWLYDILYNLLLTTSDLIILHTNESRQILHDSNSRAKIFYNFHPVTASHRKEQDVYKKEYDILIWGTMSPYKGVLDFLESQAEILKDKKIKIIGKFSDSAYFQKVNKFQSANISIENRFPTVDELYKLHQDSKFVLFPYKADSVFTSGALADALTFNCNIIGPQVGAFVDLEQLNLIKTFNNYSDIKSILNNPLDPSSLNSIRDFCERNSWTNFGKKLGVEINKLTP